MKRPKTREEMELAEKLKREYEEDKWKQEEEEKKWDNSPMETDS